MNTIPHPSHFRAPVDSFISNAKPTDTRHETVPVELIGSILTRKHRLDPSAVSRVIAEQLKDRTLRFGALAVKLGLCSATDVSMALQEQAGSTLVRYGESKLDHQLACAYTYAGQYVKTITELRFNLLLNWIEPVSRSSAPDNEGFALALISPCAKDGRSVTAANLAISFAQLGRRTLLLEADLRNSVQTKLFGLKSSGHGLSDVLRSNVQTKSAILTIEGLSCLNLLPAGPNAMNPQDLFGRPAFERTLRECKEQYDVVIIDTPPVNLAPETIVISRYSDAAVALAKDACTDAAAFDSMQAKCQQHGVNLLGSIMLGA